MRFTISYDFTQKVGTEYRTYSGNLVGKDGQTPVGYGPVGPEAIFTLEELPLVARVLTEQLATVPTLHLHPHP